jgi:tripartite-type tricarboxylate transporter receptor subunit TctC
MVQALTRRAALAAGLATPLLSSSGRAQSWPNQAIRLVVPYTPGGANDAIARPVAEALSRSLGKPVVVENRPGAGTTIGGGVVAAAPPDGHTLLLASSSSATSAAVIRTPYDPVEALASIARICVTPLVIVTKPRDGFADMKAFVAAARARPGQVQYGTAGLGGVGHFGMELFAIQAGLKLEVVPYNGMSPAQADLLSGRLDAVITTMASVKGLVDAGSVPVIANTGSARSPFAPQTPTVREQTGVDYAVDVWFGILAPRGVPREIRQRLNTEINAFIATDGYRKQLAGEAAVAAPLELDAFDTLWRDDIQRWRQVAAATGIKPA